MRGRTTATAKATKKQYAPDAAVGYYNTSKGGVDYITIQLDLSVLGLGDGKLTLVGFENKYKKADTHPDIKFKVSEPKKSAGTSAGGNRRAAAAVTEEDDSDEFPL